MPDGFKFPQNADLWQPLSTIAEYRNPEPQSRPFQVFGRLALGVSVSKPTAKCAASLSGSKRKIPTPTRTFRPQIQTFNEQHERRPDQYGVLVADGRGRFRVADRVRERRHLLLRRATNRAREIAVASRSARALARGAPAADRERDARRLQRGRRARLRRDQHPALRSRHSGRRPAVLDPVHDGHHVFVFFAADLPRDGHHFGSRRRCTSRRPTSTKS